MSLNQKNVFDKNYKEVMLWFNLFVTRFPVDDSVIYYTVKDFLIMLWIVIKEEKQFSKKPFKVIHKKRTCLECFHNQFCYTPLFSYTPILKEWIKRYSLLDPTEDYCKCLPFTEELIFVLFNFFGTHGKCL